MKRNSYGDEEFDGVHHVSCEPASYKYKIRLFRLIENTDQFIPALHALEDAGPNDEVEIHLSSLGGSLDATDTFIQAMNECQGSITVRASGTCASAASLILLQAPQFTLSNGFSCMLHCGSLGIVGTLSEVRSEAQFSPQHMESIIREAYAGFLEEEELNRMIDGKDIYMGKDEFIFRFNKREELLAEAMKEFGLEEDTN